MNKENISFFVRSALLSFFCAFLLYMLYEYPDYYNFFLIMFAIFSIINIELIFIDSVNDGYASDWIAHTMFAISIHLFFVAVFYFFMGVLKYVMTYYKTLPEFTLYFLGIILFFELNRRLALHIKY